MNAADIPPPAEHTRESRPDWAGHRWIVVADSPFLPAHGGGEREHLGFVRAATARGLLAALVVPTDDDPAAFDRQDDLAALRDLVAPAPALFVPRRRSVLAAATPWRPYVVGSRPPRRGVVADLRAMAPDATGVVIFTYKSHHLGHAVARGLGLSAVVRAHNLEGPYHHALAHSESAPKSWAIRAEAIRIDLDERRLERDGWLAGIADISSSDAAIRARRSRVPVRHVPTFALGGEPDWAAERHTPPATPVVTFIGALDVRTNHDALRWFRERVWPTVLAEVPGTCWHIVGRKPPPWLREEAAGWDSVRLFPDVPDPKEYLRGTTVAVNPAVSGSGVNIKLVEYLAMAVPVVSTERGMQGLGLNRGVDLAVADDPTVFAAEVVALLRDPDRAQRLGYTGQTTALEILDVDRSLGLLAGMFGAAA
ncbi:MAG TPA: glycosyltransferase family 4 protein [Dermatophilaceae bacterium]|nr:glycosyltransferase family 4 protein [Dermatophilaceae bacterium]